MKKLLIAIILTSLIGACCKKSNNDVKPNTTSNTTGTTINDDTVTYTIQGRLLDGKTLQPFQGADIWIGRKAYSPKNGKPSFYKIITVYGDGKFKFTYKGKDALDDYLLSPHSGFSEWPSSQPDTIVPSRKNINIDLYFSQEGKIFVIMENKFNSFPNYDSIWVKFNASLLDNSSFKTYKISNHSKNYQVFLLKSNSNTIHSTFDTTRALVDFNMANDIKLKSFFNLRMLPYNDTIRINY